MRPGPVSTEPRRSKPYQERNSYRCRIFDGQGGQSSVKATSEQDAIDQAEEVLRCLRSERHEVTVEATIKQYENHQLDATENKPRSVITTTIRLRRLFSATAKEAEAEVELGRPLAGLSPRWCERLYVALSGRPCAACKHVSPLGLRACERCGGADLGEPQMAADTHRNMLAEAKTFLEWCMAKPRRWLSKNPLAEVKGVGKRNKGKKQLRADEATKWLEVAFQLADKGDDRAVGALMTIAMGLSGEEITQRIVRDVDLKGTMLHITDGKTEERRKAVPIPPDLRPYIARACKDTLRLFPTSEG